MIVTHLDDLSDNTGHGPGHAEAADGVVEVPGIAGDNDGEEDEQSTGDDERDTSEQAGK